MVFLRYTIYRHNNAKPMCVDMHHNNAKQLCVPDGINCANNLFLKNGNDYCIAGAEHDYAIVSCQNFCTSY